MDLVGLIASTLAAWKQPLFKSSKNPLRSSANTLRIFQAGEDPGFAGPESYTILGAFFKKKNTKLRIQKLGMEDTKLGTEANAYLEREKTK